MGKIIECGTENVAQRNTGAKDQCLPGPAIRHAIAKTSQEFATSALAKSLTAWDAAVAAKEIFPLFPIEVLANANIAAKFYEARNKYLTKQEKQVVTTEILIGVCSYAALLSFNGKKMRLYEFTDDQKIQAVTDEAGVKVKGQLVSIEVGVLVKALDDKPQHCVVTITYEDWKEFVSNPVILSPTWNQLELQGIFDAEIEQVSATATNVKFTVEAGCSGDKVFNLTDTNISFKKPDGTAITHSFVAADANGVMTLTGTGFATGDLISINGVVVGVEYSIEGFKATAINVTP